MQASVVQHWLNNRIKNIGESGATVMPDLFPETIHRFRTETKKLRAILRLVHLDNSDFHKLPKSFRKLYRAAGHIRDRQMQLVYVTSGRRHKLPHFSIWLASEIVYGAREWKRRYDADVIEALAERSGQLTDRMPGLSEMRRFFHERMDRLSTIIDNAMDDTELHEGRKIVKDMQYVTTFCEKEWPEGYVLLQPLESRLQHLSERAGNYNDSSNLLASLSLFREAYADQPDRDAATVDKALRDWGAAAARERGRLIISMQSFVQRMKI